MGLGLAMSLMAAGSAVAGAETGKDPPRLTIRCPIGSLAGTSVVTLGLRIATEQRQATPCH